MNVYLMAFLVVLGYVLVALGVMRSVSPMRYRRLRDTAHMPVDDAQREARKMSAQDGFAWPVFLVAFGILAPLIILFDGVPWAGRKVAEGVATGAGALAPALAPVTGWVNKPLALEVKRDEALALTARADEPMADEPLIPDEIARWTPPISARRTYETKIADTVIEMERDAARLRRDAARIRQDAERVRARRYNR
jgi:hypothetical protein